MPLRPFPLPIRVGTDICHVSRIAKLIQTPLPSSSSIPSSPTSSAEGPTISRLKHFMRRFLSSREQELFWRRFPLQNLSLPNNADSHSSSRSSLDLNIAIRHLAGRFAAKEAVIKAFSASRRVSFLDILILPRANTIGISSSSGGGGGGVYAVILDHPASSSASDDKLDSNDQTDDHDINGQIAEVSISHDGEYATATCIAADVPRSGDVGGEAAAREP